MRPVLGVVSLAVALSASGALVGCSSAAQLSAEQRSEAQALVVDRAAVAAIELNDEDRDCVVDDLTPDDLADLRADRVASVAEAIVSCVGDETIGASVLRSQAGEISPASLDCAVNELDRRFVVDLVAGAMNGSQPQAQADIEVARVLGVCLELDELL